MHNSIIVDCWRIPCLLATNQWTTVKKLNFLDNRLIYTISLFVSFSFLCIGKHHFKVNRLTNILNVETECSANNEQSVRKHDIPPYYAYFTTWLMGNMYLISDWVPVAHWLYWHSINSHKLHMFEDFTRYTTVLYVCYKSLIRFRVYCLLHRKFVKHNSKTIENLFNLSWHLPTNEQIKIIKK